MSIPGMFFAVVFIILVGLWTIRWQDAARSHKEDLDKDDGLCSFAKSPEGRNRGQCL